MPDEYRHTSSRRRSRSPDRHRQGHERSHRKRSRSPPPVHLPLNARALSKHDLRNFRKVFGLYLDIQKQIDIEELDETEVKGRWKSFVGKWNRGELAEGWYDPATKEKADRAAPKSTEKRHSPQKDQHLASEQGREERDDDDDDDDEYGPSLPTRHGRAGPAAPRMQDLQHRNELAKEDEQSRLEDLRFERKTERKLQKERLEELNPRAEPGTRERQLEKKRETAEANRTFRDAKSPGADEVGEGELMGGEDSIKAQVQAAQRKKTERELRKEEILRAREAEREERLAEHRAKEEKTMDMLKALAKQRFG